MKKILILALVLTFALCSAAMAVMPDTIRIGDSRTVLEQAMAAEGITPCIEDDYTLAYETVDREGYFTLDAEGKVDFICYSYTRGDDFAMDFTHPDWTMTWEQLEAALTEQNACHEDFWTTDCAYPAVYVTADFFGMKADLALEFGDNGLLSKVSMQAYEQPAMMWALVAAGELGVPEAVNLNTTEEGICTYVTEDTAWVMEDGSYYTLSSNVSFVVFPGDDGQQTMANTEVELCVFAPEK